MLKKNFSRSNNTPELINEVIKDINRKKDEAFVKSASSEVAQPPKKVKLTEANSIIKSCKNHGMGIYESSNGNVWKVVKDANGDAWLEIDDELTAECSIVNDIIKSASLEKKKLAAKIDETEYEDNPDLLAEDPELLLDEDSFIEDEPEELVDDEGEIISDDNEYKSDKTIEELQEDEELLADDTEVAKEVEGDGLPTSKTELNKLLSATEKEILAIERNAHFKLSKEQLARYKELLNSGDLDETEQVEFDKIEARIGTLRKIYQENTDALKNLKEYLDKILSKLGKKKVDLDTQVEDALLISDDEARADRLYELSSDYGLSKDSLAAITDGLFTYMKSIEPGILAELEPLNKERKTLIKEIQNFKGYEKSKGKYRRLLSKVDNNINAYMKKIPPELLSKLGPLYKERDRITADIRNISSKYSFINSSIKDIPADLLDNIKVLNKKREEILKDIKDKDFREEDTQKSIKYLNRIDKTISNNIDAIPPDVMSKLGKNRKKILKDINIKNSVDDYIQNSKKLLEDTEENINSYKVNISPEILSKLEPLNKKRDELIKEIQTDKVRQGAQATLNEVEDDIRNISSEYSKIRQGITNANIRIVKYMFRKKGYEISNLSDRVDFEAYFNEILAKSINNFKEKVDKDGAKINFSSYLFSNLEHSLPEFLANNKNIKTKNLARLPIADEDKPLSISSIKKNEEAWNGYLRDFLENESQKTVGGSAYISNPNNLREDRQLWLDSPVGEDDGGLTLTDVTTGEKGDFHNRVEVDPEMINLENLGMEPVIDDITGVDNRDNILLKEIMSGRMNISDINKFYAKNNLVAGYNRIRPWITHLQELVENWKPSANIINLYKNIINENYQNNLYNYVRGKLAIDKPDLKEKDINRVIYILKHLDEAWSPGGLDNIIRKFETKSYYNEGQPEEDSNYDNVTIANNRNRYEAYRMIASNIDKFIAKDKDKKFAVYIANIKKVIESELNEASETYRQQFEKERANQQNNEKSMKELDDIINKPMTEDEIVSAPDEE